MGQAKKLYCVRHYAEVAKVVVYRIRRANNWYWPRSDEEWEFVARRFKWEIEIVFDDPQAQSCCVVDERLIIIEYTPDQRRRHRDMAHEVAHVILLETVPPKHILDWPSTGDDSHYVAQLVEEWVDRDIAERSQLELKWTE